MRGGSLMFFAKNTYSQNGEDGVLAEVLRRLDITTGTFVEFGAGDGRSLSNTLNLAEQGWSGVWIEANAESAAKARIEAKRFGDRVEVLNTTVEVNGDRCLDVLLGFTRARYIDFMSIDIDSYDLEVWESLKSYQPKIVLIEINSGVPLGVEQRHGGGKEGASFTSTMQVATRQGYRLACHTGNLLFVDKNLFPKLRLPGNEVNNHASIFNPMWVEWAQQAAAAKGGK